MSEADFVARISPYAFAGIREKQSGEVSRSANTEKDSAHGYVSRIIRMVCAYFDIPKDKMISKTRERSICWPRQVAAYLAYKHTNVSLKEIGIKLGGKDHTTVMHSRQAVKDMLETDEKLR